MNDFNIRQCITVIGCTNGQESPEERKGRIQMNPHIDLHGIFQIIKGDRDYQKKVYCQGELPFAINVKGGEKN
jgi:hypothetical protein